MARLSDAARLAHGAAFGCVVLGAGGRLAMALVSALTPLPLGFTWRGTAAVVVTGGIYGVVGAGLDWVAQHRLRSRPARVVTVGLALFVVIGVVSAALNQVSAAWLYPALTVACFLPLTAGFAAALARRWP